MIASLKRHWIVFLVGLIAFVFFALRAFTLLDPDFGWHVRMGEIITTSGVPATDTFSYTMPSFPFVDHEWVTNILMWTLYESAGKVILSLLFILLAFGAIYIALANSLSRKIGEESALRKTILFVVGAGAIYTYFGIRPQVESWFYISILFYLLFNNHIWQKWKYALPLLFTLWVNTHTSFEAGIAILFFVLSFRSFRKRHVEFSDTIVFGLSLVATFLNPYGTKIWSAEVISQITDSSLRWKIGEWMPSIFDFNIAFIFLAAISTMLLVKYRKKFYLEEKGIFLVMLLQAVGTTRHVPLWTMIALPITSVGLSFLYQDVKKIRYGKERFLKICKYAFGLCAIMIGAQSTLLFRNVQFLTEDNFYPKAALEFFRTNEGKGETFSEYGWGGYLIWKYPERKVFIDGRMPSWRWNQNPPNEEGYAFDTYSKLLSGETDYKLIFDKYDIETVLWPKQQEKSGINSYFPNVENSLRLFFGGKEKGFSFFAQLEKDGWVKVYEDEISVVYRKS